MAFHYVTGPVYCPLEIDVDGETMTQDDIQKMAHDFVSKGLSRNIDVMHDQCPSGAEVVESFIVEEGMKIGGVSGGNVVEYPPGTWVMKVRLPEGDLWESIKSGNLNGYSFQAKVKKVPRRVLVDIARIVVGSTFENNDVEILPSHQHQYYIELNSDGRVVLGMTDDVLSHSHQIFGTVVTEEELSHTHRFEVQ